MDGRRDAVVTSLRTPCSIEDERRLKSIVLNHLRAGRVVHVIDLGQLCEVSTRLMNALLGLFYAVHREDGLIALVIARPDVLRSFAIAGLDGIFPIFPDIAQAVLAAEAYGRDSRDCARAVPL